VVFFVWPAVLAKAQEKMIDVMHWKTWRRKYTASSLCLYCAPRGMANSAAAAVRGKSEAMSSVGVLRLVYVMANADSRLLAIPIPPGIML